MSSFRVAAVLLLILSSGTSHALAELFQMKVVNSQTGRGVPLVELQPSGGPKFITDSNGIAGLTTFVAAALLAVRRRPFTCW